MEVEEKTVEMKPRFSRSFFEVIKALVRPADTRSDKRESVSCSAAKVKPKAVKERARTRGD